LNEAVGERRFAVIDVRDDRKIANVIQFQSLFSWKCARRSKNCECDPVSILAFLDLPLRQAQTEMEL
jgi:hypothetical protein